MSKPLIAIATIPEAEIHIDENLVRGLLREQCPQLADLPLQFFSNGWDNSLFRLGENHLVRLPRRQLGATTILNEQRYLHELAPRLPLPVPVPVHCGLPSNAYPWHWSITPLIVGDTADKSLPNKSAVKQWAHFLRMLHYPAPEDGPKNGFRGDGLSQGADVFVQRFQRLCDKDAISFQGANSVWQAGLEADATYSKAWLHGDLHPMNILCINGNFSGVIDWGDLCVGDVAVDLASFWMLFDGGIAEHSIQHDYRASEAQILRSKASALYFAVVLLDTGLDNNEQQVRVGKTILRNLGL